MKLILLLDKADITGNREEREGGKKTNNNNPKLHSFFSKLHS